MKPNEFPAGWDEQTIREIVEYYEAQTDEEAAAEHEALLDKIADELRNAPPLSDEAVSRAGIYADHP
ncbi:MAG: hypothetical protein ACJ76N_03645 [Thermoanaerobaculia bacterium]